MQFIHCKQCQAEKPLEISAQDWSRLDVAVLADGRLRVWCRRHNRLVVDWPIRLPASA